MDLFLRNLLLEECHGLHNRAMHISGTFAIASEQDDPIKLSDRERQLLQQLRREPDLTRRELAEVMQCSESTVKRILQRLSERKVLRRIGSRKMGEWVVNDFADRNEGSKS